MDGDTRASGWNWYSFEGILVLDASTPTHNGDNFWSKSPSIVPQAAHARVWSSGKRATRYKYVPAIVQLDISILHSSGEYDPLLNLWPPG